MRLGCALPLAHENGALGTAAIGPADLHLGVLNIAEGDAGGLS